VARGIRIIRMRKLDDRVPPLNRRIREIIYSLDLGYPGMMEAIQKKKEEKGCAGADSFKFLESELSIRAARAGAAFAFTIDRRRKKLLLRLSASPARGFRSQDIVRDVLGLAQPVFAMAREEFVFADNTPTQNC